MSGWTSYCPSSRAMAFVTEVEAQCVGSVHHNSALCRRLQHYLIFLPQSYQPRVQVFHSKFTSHILTLKSFAFTRQAISQRPQTCMSTFGFGCPTIAKQSSGQRRAGSPRYSEGPVFNCGMVQLVQQLAMDSKFRGSTPGGERHSAPVQTGPEAPSTSFLEVIWPGRGVDYLLTYSAKVKERVELYVYSPSWLSRPVPGPTLPLPVFDSVPRDLLFSLRLSLIFTVSSANQQYTVVSQVGCSFYISHVLQLIIIIGPMMQRTKSELLTAPLQSQQHRGKFEVLVDSLGRDYLGIALCLKLPASDSLYKSLGLLFLTIRRLISQLILLRELLYILYFDNLRRLM